METAVYVILSRAMEHVSGMGTGYVMETQNLNVTLCLTYAMAVRMAITEHVAMFSKNAQSVLSILQWCKPLTIL